LYSSTCGMATPSWVVKSRLTGSALKPMVTAASLTALALAVLALLSLLLLSLLLLSLLLLSLLSLLLAVPALSAVVCVALAVLSCWSESPPEQAVKPTIAVAARRYAASSAERFDDMLDSPEKYAFGIVLVWSGHRKPVAGTKRLLCWRKGCGAAQGRRCAGVAAAPAVRTEACLHR